MTNKVGRARINLIYDSQGNIIDGLSFDNANQTYRCQYKEKGKWVNKYFGRNKEKAIENFRQWQGEKENKTVAYMKLSPEPPDISGKKEFIKQELNEEVLWGYVRHKLQTDPLYVANKLQLPALSNPELLKHWTPKKSYTLKEIWENYNNRINHITKREKESTKRSWLLFLSITKATTISELDKPLIQIYFDKMYSDFKKDKSTTWIRQHFERVKRVVNYALDSFEHTAELIEVKQRLKTVLKPPRPSIQNPARKIPKEVFLSILEASTVEEKAMWLLSMNFAYYPIDIATLPKSVIDFKTKTIIFRRGKTGVHRAGILWQETIEAVKEYLKEYPHNLPTLFQNKTTKGFYLPERISEKFQKIAETLNVNYKHSNFRDSFESICSKVEQKSVDAVLGHTGISAKYTDVESTPEIAAPACEAVRLFYFGK